MISSAVLAKAFCPTGPGGGIDPTCSPSGGGYGRGIDKPGLSLDERLTIFYRNSLKAIKLNNGTLLVGKPGQVHQEVIARAYKKLFHRDPPTLGSAGALSSHYDQWKRFIGTFYDGTDKYGTKGYVSRANTKRFISETQLDAWQRGGFRKILAKAFCPTGPGGGIDPHCAPDGGGGGSGGGGKWNPDKPTRGELDRAQRVAHEMTDGPASDYIDRQMRGGILNQNTGKFTKFTPQSKLTNLRRLKAEMDKVRAKDPEAYDNFMQWSLASSLGYKNYADIPEVVSVYRGHALDERLGRMTNVSTKEATAQSFGAKTTQYRVPKGDLLPIDWASSFPGETEMVIFDTRRMKPILKSILAKAFCPTGPGGGIDNSCAPGEGGGKQTATGAAKRVPVKARDGPDAPGASADITTRIRDVLSQHDPKVVATLKAVVVMAPKDFKEYAARYVYSDQVQGFYDPDRSRLFIPRNATDQTINHEIGHHAFAMIDRDWKEHWVTTFNMTDPISKYAHDGEEQFAEVYAAYTKTGGKAHGRKYKELFDDMRRSLATVSAGNRAFSVWVESPLI